MPQACAYTRSNHMQSLAIAIKKTYAKHAAVYDELAFFEAAIKKNAAKFPPSFSNLIPKLTIVTFKNKTLTCAVPSEMFSPDIHIFAHAFKNTLNDILPKKIMLVRFVRGTYEAR
jgi:hypothetical protein